MKTITLIKRITVVSVAVSSLVFGGYKAVDAIETPQERLESHVVEWVSVYPREGEGLYALVDRVNKGRDIDTQSYAHMVREKNNMPNSSLHVYKAVLVPVVK